MSGSREMIVRPLVAANEPCACLSHGARCSQSYGGTVADGDDVPQVVSGFTRNLSGARRKHTYRAVHQRDFVVFADVLGHRSRIPQAAEGPSVENRAVGKQIRQKIAREQVTVR